MIEQMKERSRRNNDTRTNSNSNSQKKKKRRRRNDSSDGKEKEEEEKNLFMGIALTAAKRLRVGAKHTHTLHPSILDGKWLLASDPPFRSSLNGFVNWPLKSWTTILKPEKRPFRDPREMADI